MTLTVSALSERESQTSEPGQWSATAFNKWARRDLAAAVNLLDLDYHVTPKSLRHSFVSLLLHEGRAVTYVAEQAGHTVETLSRDYASVIHELDGGRRSVPTMPSSRRASSAHASSADQFHAQDLDGRH